MKTKFLKIILPAFALMLAITASLAFTTVEEDVKINAQFYLDRTQTPQQCIALPVIVQCETEDTGTICSWTNTGVTPPKTHDLYLERISSTQCDIILYKIIL